MKRNTETDLVISIAIMVNEPSSEQSVNTVRSALISAFEECASSRVKSIETDLLSETVWVQLDTHTIRYDQLKDVRSQIGEVGRVHSTNITTLAGHRMEYEDMNIEPPL